MNEEALLERALNELSEIRDEIQASREKLINKFNDILTRLGGERFPTAGECKKAVADINNTKELLHACFTLRMSGKLDRQRVSLRYSHTTNKEDAGVFQAKGSTKPQKTVYSGPKMPHLEVGKIPFLGASG